MTQTEEQSKPITVAAKQSTGTLASLVERRPLPQEYKNFEYLELFRSLAHLAIVCLHIGFASGAIFDHGNKPYPQWMTIIGHYMGVDVLFCISAVLATYEILRKCDSNTFSIREFYVNRFYRFMPTLYAALVFFSLVVPFKKTFIWDFLFMTDYVPTHNQFFGLAWSVAADMKFTLIAPFLVFALKRMSNKQRFLIVAAMTMLSMLNRTTSILRNVTDGNRFVNYYYFGEDALNPELSNHVAEKLSVQDSFYYGLHLRFMPFVYGTLVAIFRYEQMVEKKPGVQETSKLSSTTRMSIWAAALVCFLAGNVMPLEWYLATYNRALFYFGVAYDLGVVCIGLVLYMCLFGDSAIFFAKWRIWTVISKLTFCSYLFHFIAIGTVIETLKNMKVVLSLTLFNFALVASAVIAVNALVALFVYWLVEKPAMDWRVRKLKRDAPVNNKPASSTA